MLDTWPDLPIFIDVDVTDHEMEEIRDHVVGALGLNDPVSGIRIEHISDSGWEIIAPLCNVHFPH